MARSQFQQLLEARIAQRRAAVTEELAAGKPATFEKYRELVGHLRGFEEVLLLCDQINQDMNTA